MGMIGLDEENMISVLERSERQGISTALHWDQSVDQEVDDPVLKSRFEISLLL